MYDFKLMLMEAGLNDVEKLAAFFEVTQRTARNWKKNGPPKAVFLCLQLMTGRLDALGKEWKGFRLLPDIIESPEGEFVYSHEVKAIKYIYNAAGIERHRICQMLKHQTPVRKGNKTNNSEKIVPLTINWKRNKLKNMR